MPSRWENGKRVWIEDWGSHTDRMIREAQKRGEFENLPGAGKPIVLDENVFAGDMDSAYRVARNANAAPLWITLDKEVSDDLEALASLLERTARYMEEQAARAITSDGTLSNVSGAPRDAAMRNAASPKPRWWPFGRNGRPKSSAGAGSAGFPTLASLEAERQRARALYLSRAAEVDKKIEQYNSLRPPHLTWLEKPRLPAAVAERRFDARLPAFGASRG
jgi:hypothetical protein